MKSSDCLVLLACGTLTFGGCASTGDEFNTTEATDKPRETVPGEVNPNAPDASQQARTKPGFNF
jgi:hypothetical protein